MDSGDKKRGGDSGDLFVPSEISKSIPQGLLTCTHKNVLTHTPMTVDFCHTRQTLHPLDPLDLPDPLFVAAKNI